ncbi:uncharacterized protein LOC111864419 [Cryptotermes secundus]|uniref:uncharacterized protein LOC111864419 n=1 Tax=Cryptotermes secundus TaxID=105785 RepID=UPI000CD7B386|nr:uncharacterized protein LOC111864419 [Cryptotermes secundus]
MKVAVVLLLFSAVVAVVTAAPSDSSSHHRATRQLPSPPSPPGFDGSTDSFPGADKFKLPQLPTPEEAAVKVLEHIPQPMLDAAATAGETVEGFMPSEISDGKFENFEDIAAKGMEQAGKMASNFGIGDS